MSHPSTTDSKLNQHTRPAWMSDAKWVVGIIAFGLVALTALVMSLTRLTEREPALDLMSAVTASMFSPQGLDDAKDIDQTLARLRSQPSQSLEVLPGLSVTADEVEGKSPREIRLHIFRKLAQPIYDRGSLSGARSGETSEVSSETSEVKAERSNTLTPTAKNVGLLVLISAESHQWLVGAQTMLLIVSGLLLVLLVFFSTGFGRLASLGWIFLLVGFLPSILIFFVDMSLRTNSPAPPSGEPTIGAMALSVGTTVAPIVLTILKGIYWPLLVGGLGLILIATIGGIALAVVHRGQRKQAQ